MEGIFLPVIIFFLRRNITSYYHMMPFTYLSNLLYIRKNDTVKISKGFSTSSLVSNLLIYTHKYLNHGLNLGLIVLVSIYIRDSYRLHAILVNLSIWKQIFLTIYIYSHKNGYTPIVTRKWLSGKRLALIYIVMIIGGFPLWIIQG